MDGFNGEAFGLSNKDSEMESYKAIAKMQKLVEGFEGQIKILGEK